MKNVIGQVPVHVEGKDQSKRLKISHPTREDKKWVDRMRIVPARLSYPSSHSHQSHFRARKKKKKKKEDKWKQIIGESTREEKRREKSKGYPSTIHPSSAIM
jgi:hypothetical protein